MLRRASARNIDGIGPKAKRRLLGPRGRSALPPQRYYISLLYDRDKTIAALYYRKFLAATHHPASMARSTRRPSSSVSRTSAAAIESSAVSMRLAPGIGRTAGDRAMSQARTSR